MASAMRAIAVERQTVETNVFRQSMNQKQHCCCFLPSNGSKHGRMQVVKTQGIKSMTRKKTEAYFSSLWSLHSGCSQTDTDLLCADDRTVTRNTTHNSTTPHQPAKWDHTDELMRFRYCFMSIKNIAHWLVVSILSALSPLHWLKSILVLVLQERGKKRKSRSEQHSARR